MPIAKRTLRVQLSGGFSQDVDAKMMPDGAVERAVNMYYDRNFALRRRDGHSTVCTGPVAAYPMAAFSRGEDRMIVEADIGGGAVYSVSRSRYPYAYAPLGRTDTDGVRTAHATSIVSAGAVIRLEGPAPTQATGSGSYCTITPWGARDDGTTPTYYAWSPDKLVRVYCVPGSASIVLDAWRFSSTAPDGVVEQSQAFLVSGTSGANKCAIGTDPTDPSNGFTWAAVLDSTTMGVTATYNGSGATTGIGTFGSTSPIYTTSLVKVWVSGREVIHQSANDNLNVRTNTAPSTSRVVVDVTTLDAGAGISTVAGGHNPDGSCFLAYRTAGNTTAVKTMLGALGAILATNPISSSWVSVPRCSSPLAGVARVVTAGPTGSTAAVVTMIGAQEEYQGERRAIVYATAASTPPDVQTIRPVAAAAPMTFKVSGHVGGVWVISDSTYNGEQPTVSWVGHEVSRGTTDPIRAYEYRLPFLDRQSCQPVEVDGVWYYSGATISHAGGELGFFLHPFNTRATPTGGTGVGGLGTTRVASWRAVYEWDDGLGRREQSAPSIAVTAAVTSSTQHIAIAIYPPVTRKAGVRARVYRDVQLGGQVHHEVGAVTFSPAEDYAYFTDDVSDTEAAKREVLYADQGVPDYWLPETREHTALWSHGGRLWTADGARARFSIESRPSEFVAFQADAYVALPSEVVAFASWGDTLAILCVGGVYLLSGQGPTRDLAQPWPAPYHVPGAPGCSAQYGGQRSVTAFPGGIVYRSGQGITLLSPSGGGLTASLLSDPIQDVLAARPYVLNATHDPKLASVRFLLDTAATLSDFTNFSATMVWEYGASAIAGRPVWHLDSGPGTHFEYAAPYYALNNIRCEGMFGAEVASAYMGGGGPSWFRRAGVGDTTGFISSVTLGRIRPGGGAGHGRIYSAVVLADCTSTPGSLNVDWEWDDGSTDTVGLNVPYPQFGPDYAHHITPARQKCHHAIITLREDQRAYTTAVEGVVWNAVTLELGTLPGARRLIGPYKRY